MAVIKSKNNSLSFKLKNVLTEIKKTALVHSNYRGVINWGFGVA